MGDCFLGQKVCWTVCEGLRLKREWHIDFLLNRYYNFESSIKHDYYYTRTSIFETRTRTSQCRWPQRWKQKLSITHGWYQHSSDRIVCCFFRLSEIQTQNQRFYVDIWTGHVYVLCNIDIETEANAPCLQAWISDTFFPQASIRPCHMRSFLICPCFALRFVEYGPFGKTEISEVRKLPARESLFLKCPRWKWTCIHPSGILKNESEKVIQDMVTSLHLNVGCPCFVKLNNQIWLLQAFLLPNHRASSNRCVCFLSSAEAPKSTRFKIRLNQICFDQLASSTAVQQVCTFCIRQRVSSAKAVNQTTCVLSPTYRKNRNLSEIGLAKQET